MTLLNPSQETRDRVNASFEAMEATPASKRLRWLYMGTGLIWCACSVGPMTAQEVGDIPLGFAFLGAMGTTWSVHKYLFRQPLLILAAVWAAWVTLSLLWSKEPHRGGWDLASLRFFWTIPAVWPLMRARGKL